MKTKTNNMNGLSLRARAEKMALRFGVCIAALVSCASLFTRCLTQPAPPGGGPKDTIPPILMATSIPANETFMKGKTVIFYFNENIALRNQRKEIIVNPNEPKNRPNIYKANNKIYAHWKKALSQNTTYSINLGRSVTDLNEGNPYDGNIYFSFSTGGTIDTSIVFGLVVDASTGKGNADILLTLYKEMEDSAVMLKDPFYMTKTDSLGRYVFWNIHPDKYKIYAINDPSYSGKYLSSSQLFAFFDDTLSIDKAITKVPLMYAFSVPKKEKPSLSFSSVKKEDSAIKKKDTLSYTASVKPIMYVQDTLTLFFSQALEKIDTNKILFYKDSVLQKSIALTSGFSKDSTTYNVTLHLRFLPKKEIFEAIIPEDFVQDIRGNRLLRADTLHFFSAEATAYGSLEIVHTIKNTDRDHYVIQIKSGNKILFSFPISESTISLPYIPTGKYNVEILNDKNRNGVWDYGSFWVDKRQPEIVTALEKELEIVSQEKTTYIIELPRSLDY